VRAALYAVPSYFRVEFSIGGIPATDLHTLNTSLGATIEETAVQALNQLRATWDPDGQYQLYSFVRQAQTFPDVLLRRADTGHILMGVELKGWYLLAKEKEPSFRLDVTPDACAPADLVAVYPWALDSVISGRPKLFAPFVQNARYVAAFRNYHWQFLMGNAGSAARSITLATGASPYPNKASRIKDTPASDAGGNFGRIARTPLMETFVRSADDEKLYGIAIRHWRSFFKAFKSNQTEEEIAATVDGLVRSIQGRTQTLGQEQLDEIRGHLTAIAALLASR
jgi:hypothetical protein